MNKNNNQERKQKHYVDFHLHTHYSDGTSSPTQIVKDCALLGIDTIAITDHDHLEGYFEAKEEAKNWPVHVIGGIEISTDKYHILGLDINPTDKVFREIIDLNRERQQEKVRRRIHNLQEQGIPLTMEKLEHYFPHKPMMNKIHLSIALFRDEECRTKLETANMESIFQTYLGKQAPAHTIDWVPMIHPEQAIKAIHDAGGKAFIAHPFLDIDDMSELETLINYGLDGIEIQPNFGERNTPYLAFAKEKGLLLTYGSDYHGGRYVKRPLLEQKENYITPFWNSESKISGTFKEGEGNNSR